MPLLVPTILQSHQWVLVLKETKQEYKKADLLQQQELASNKSPVLAIVGMLGATILGAPVSSLVP